MYSRKLASRVRHLQSLIDKARLASSDDLSLQGHWGRYLCILVAGFLEKTIGEIYAEFGRRAGSDPVARFVERKVARIRNPKSQQFIEIAASFKQEWSTQLEIFLNRDGRREAIDSIINTRNLVAHGESAGITVVRVSEYFTKCIEVAEFLEHQCGFEATYE